MPLALTPGYGELTDILSPHQSESASQTGDAHTDDGSIAQAETIEDEADETEDTPQEQPDDGAQSAPAVKARLWLWIVLAVGLLLFLLAAAALRYALIRRRWRYRFERTAPAQSVAWVTGALAALWPAMGLGYDGGSVFAFGESLRESDAEYAGAVRDLAALNGEACFSSRTMTREARPPGLETDGRPPAKECTAAAPRVAEMDSLPVLIGEDRYETKEASVARAAACGRHAAGLLAGAGTGSGGRLVLPRCRLERHASDRAGAHQLHGRSDALRSAERQRPQLWAGREQRDADRWQNGQFHPQ